MLFHPHFIMDVITTYLFMLGLKLNHVSKSGPMSHTPHTQLSYRVKLCNSLGVVLTRGQTVNLQ